MYLLCLLQNVNAIFFVDPKLRLPFEKYEIGYFR